MQCCWFEFRNNPGDLTNASVNKSDVIIEFPQNTSINVPGFHRGMLYVQSRVFSFCDIDYRALHDSGLEKKMIHLAPHGSNFQHLSSAKALNRKNKQTKRASTFQKVNKT